MIEMRLRHLYNTTSERQDVRQEYDIFIRYSLLILLINALIIKTHPNKVGMTHSFFFLREIKKNVVIQAFHSVPEVKACSSRGRVQYLSLGAFIICYAYTARVPKMQLIGNKLVR